MSRVRSALAAAGLLAASSGYGQAPPPAIVTTPLPTTVITPAGNPVAAAYPPAGGFSTSHVGGFLAPGYHGGYIAPYYAGFGYGGFGYGAYPSYLYGYTGYPSVYYGTSSMSVYAPSVDSNIFPTSMSNHPVDPPPVVYPLQPPAPANQVNVAVSGQQTASLVVALPAAGDVWLDGAKQKDSGAAYTLTSPVIGPGQTYKFDVRAEWTTNGQRYRADRTVSVAAGDRQKLTLVLGDPVK